MGCYHGNDLTLIPFVLLHTQLLNPSACHLHVSLYCCERPVQNNKQMAMTTISRKLFLNICVSKWRCQQARSVACHFIQINPLRLRRPRFNFTLRFKLYPLWYSDVLPDWLSLNKKSTNIGLSVSRNFFGWQDFNVQ